MRFIPKLLERLPNAKILIGGRDRVLMVLAVRP